MSRSKYKSRCDVVGTAKKHQKLEAQRKDKERQDKEKQLKSWRDSQFRKRQEGFLYLRTLIVSSGSDSKDSAVRETWVRSLVGKIPWRRAWQPTPVFLPGESRGQRSLAGYSPWGRKESDTTEQLGTAQQIALEAQTWVENSVQRP